MKIINKKKDNLVLGKKLQPGDCFEYEGIPYIIPTFAGAYLAVSLDAAHAVSLKNGSRLYHWNMLVHKIIGTFTY